MAKIARFIMSSRHGHIFEDFRAISDRAKADVLSTVDVDDADDDDQHKDDNDISTLVIDDPIFALKDIRKSVP